MADPRMVGRSVVVTGAAAGIGKAIALALLDEGARVVVADLDATQAQRAADELKERGVVHAVACDVSDRADVERLMDEGRAALGGLDVLVNNAGISSPCRFEELTDAEWDRVMAVNAKGTFLCCQAALRAMVPAGGGAIVNMASQAAQRGQALIAHYCASKGAVLSLTKALAREFAPLVRVNAVAPGTVATAMLDDANAELEAMQGVPRGSMLRDALAETPLRRLQTPESVAAAVLFLASDDARDLTGQTLNVSGGLVV